MTLASMTGYARSAGALGALTWQWELKSVNGKAFDARLRLPQGFDHLEASARSSLMQGFKRGNVQASLSTAGSDTDEKIVVNDLVLNQYVELAKKLQAKLGGEPVRADAMLSLKGVFEFVITPVTEAEQLARDEAILESLNEAVKSLGLARRDEGSKLNSVLSAQVSRIEELTCAARDNPSRTPDAIQVRLKEQVNRLLETSASFDADRLHQEAVLLATRADIQEEVDRLLAHVSSARDLLRSREPVGRKLDFLAQEFNREANTLCSKAGDKAMTNIGLDFKTTIDQLREQVQNIE
jgi:uncharacterized protein (TIGR00255 family)